ncbi:hypothetical protein ARSEF1564_006968 [Beauveria bassiana]
MPTIMSKIFIGRQKFSQHVPTLHTSCQSRTADMDGTCARLSADQVPGLAQALSSPLTCIAYQ